MHNENQSSEKFSPSEYKGEVSSEHGVASSYEYSGGVGVPNDYKGEAGVPDERKGEAGAEMRADSLEVQEGSSEQFTSEQSNGVVPNIMPVPSHMRKRKNQSVLIVAVLLQYFWFSLLQPFFLLRVRLLLKCLVQQQMCMGVSPKT